MILFIEIALIITRELAIYESGVNDGSQMFFKNDRRSEHDYGRRHFAIVFE